MPQLYSQLASRPSPWLLGRTSAGLCTLQTACPLTVTYSGGSPAADTIAAGTAATVYGGSAVAFDVSADVWVVLTVPASGALQVVKEADLATVTGDWSGLARIVQHSTEPYQPQAYLGAGGLGSAPATTTTVVSAASGDRVLNLWTGSANSAAPSNWQLLGYDDSAWATPVVVDLSMSGVSPLAGTAGLWSSDPAAAATQENLFRRVFVLPAGVVTAATLAIFIDDEVTGIWVNGAFLYSVAHLFLGFSATGTLTVPPALLTPGGPNVLAIAHTNVVLPQAWIDYRLDVTTLGTGGLPTPAGAVEGDLLYYHSGAWIRLPAGTNGYALTMVSGDPAWTAQPADSDYTDPLTTKGDLLTRSSSATVRLGVGSNGQVVTADSTQADGIKWATPSSGGVTSVDVAVPAPLSAGGGPLTSSGTITLSWASGQTANRVLASPDGTTGAVSLRALVAGDVPSLPASQITSGQLATARGGTGLDGSAAANGALLIGTGSGYALATLTAGSGVTITNGSGTVTIASSGGGTGTVTSVALTVPGFLSVSGSPVTTSGTLAVTLATENANTVFAGPSSGSAAAPTFRALAASDLPPAAAAGGHVHAHGHFL